VVVSFEERRKLAAPLESTSRRTVELPRVVVNSYSPELSCLSYDTSCTRCNYGGYGVKNATMFKKVAHISRYRAARTKFQWTKGHNGTIGNEESDKLAKEGANKRTPDVLDLNIPVEFDIQGAKLSTLTQAKAYKGIMRSLTTPHRKP